MGNCLVLEEKVIKVVKPDGKVLEYRSPIKAFEVLSEFSGHALSAETTTSGSVLLNQHHLKPETRLLGGHLYYLVPVPLPAKKKTMKKVRFTEPEKEEEKKPERETTAKINSSSSKVVRIKLVISKQKLQELLKGTGGGSVLTVDDMVSKLHSDQKIKLDGSDDCDRFNLDDGDDDYDFQREGCNWKPVLESIPELN